ncbi:methoxymalonate biosynthesis acyl carrier protein [Catenulispora sp. MAP5-51]|uniref:acyl carrier protein n=1 Tax=Catenulispora sp. MAP5-51 TaxID=3156298 RepID=UPI0035179F81
MTAPTSARQERGDAVRRDLMSFLEQRTKRAVAADVDLFAAGLVSSLFALELVMHLEQSFGVTVAGPDLTLDNFQTVEAMTALVLRLGGDGSE